MHKDAPEVERFSFQADADPVYNGMIADDAGQYVTFSAHQQALAAKDERIAELEQEVRDERQRANDLHDSASAVGKEQIARHRELGARAEKADADLASFKERLLGDEAIETVAQRSLEKGSGALSWVAATEKQREGHRVWARVYLKAALDKALSTQPYQENTFQEDLAEVEAEARGEDWPQRNAGGGLTKFGLYVESLRWALSYIDKRHRFPDDRPVNGGDEEDDWMEHAAALDLLKDAASAQPDPQDHTQPVARIVSELELQAEYTDDPTARTAFRNAACLLRGFTSQDHTTGGSERERLRNELGVLGMMLRENQRHEEGDRNRYDEKGERTHPRRLMHDGKAAAYRHAAANLAPILAALPEPDPSGVQGGEEEGAVDLIRSFAGLHERLLVCASAATVVRDDRRDTPYSLDGCLVGFAQNLDAAGFDLAGLTFATRVAWKDVRGAWLRNAAPDPCPHCAAATTQPNSSASRGEGQ